jgi:hypothetical protein
LNPRKPEPTEQKQVVVKKDSEKITKERKPNTKNNGNGNGKIKSYNRFEDL